MEHPNVHFLWRTPPAHGRFRTGVCLHGHTQHSEECLSFLPRYLHHVPGISQVVRGYEQPRDASRPAVDFARAYWTPPLSPATALSVERGQIENLGLQALVSLTDHDDIQAGLALQVTASRDEVPISVEWTVPYQGSIFHLGIHNLPSADSAEWIARLNAFTSAAIPPA